MSIPLKEDVAESKEFIGRFRTVERVEVRARVSGYLDKINFRDGQFINKGDVLFVIDQRSFRIALQQVEAVHKSAQIRYDLSQKDFKRARVLKPSGAISRELFDQREQESNLALSDLAVAKSGLDAAKLELEFTEVRAPVSGRISEHYISVGNLITGGAESSTLLTRIVSFIPSILPLRPVAKNSPDIYSNLMRRQAHSMLSQCMYG